MNLGLKLIGDRLNVTLRKRGDKGGNISVDEDMEEIEPLSIDGCAKSCSCYDKQNGGSSTFKNRSTM